MPVFFRSMALWPGYRGLWFRGDFTSLLIAVNFAVVLDVALLSTFIWTEWLSTKAIVALWSIICLSAVTSFLFSFRSLETRSRRMRIEEVDRLFREAQSNYLRGEYVDAEASLHRILNSGTEDMEAALLLASILRRTNRPEQARNWLDRLEKFEAANRWGLEIAHERGRLALATDA